MKWSMFGATEWMNLIGSAEFRWSANFAKLMKARARCSRAMKLSVAVKCTSPIEEAFQIAYL